MLERLKQKWKVNGLQLFLILCVFAITGTTTAFITRQITGWLRIEPSSPWYWLLKVAVLIFGYQILILLVSIPFGQFRFFWNYEKKILGWIGRLTGIKNRHLPMHRIAIFASGAGSNAQKLIDHFRSHASIRVSLIACNKPGAGVLEIAARENIPTLLLEKERFFRGDAYLDILTEKGIDFIVLAGFLWKIPTALIQAYPNKIINIHPALLPKYGGKGMYGNIVHQAVLNAGDSHSGITIHYVDEQYDHGQVIFQASCPVDEKDTPESLAQKVHQLEHENYPRVVEELLK